MKPIDMGNAIIERRSASGGTSSFRAPGALLPYINCFVFLYSNETIVARAPYWLLAIDHETITSAEHQAIRISDLGRIRGPMTKDA